VTSSKNFSYSKTALLAGFSLFLASCATPPKPADSVDVDTHVRQPAEQDSAGVQVFPLKNPAVGGLLEDADRAESDGQYDRAAMLLERALRIQPRNPEVLQRMAEVQLSTGDYEQALNFAVRSYDVGPRVGEICSRNWRTIGVSRENLGDSKGSREALQRARSCMVTKPQGM